MQIFLILAFSIAVLFSDDKLLFKGLVDNNYTLIKENLNKENINKDFSKAEFLKEIKFGELGKTRKIRNYIHAMQKISIGIEKSLVLLAYSGASRPLGFYIFINEFKDRPFDEKILDLFFIILAAQYFLFEKFRQTAAGSFAVIVVHIQSGLHHCGEDIVV